MKRIVWTTLDSDLLQQVKELEVKFGTNFEGLLVILLKSFLEFETLKRGEEDKMEDGEEL